MSFFEAIYVCKGISIELLQCFLIISLYWKYIIFSKHDDRVVAEAEWGLIIQIHNGNDRKLSWGVYYQWKKLQRPSLNEK